MEYNELPLEPRYLGVPSCASDTISEVVVCLVQTVQLSCTYLALDLTLFLSGP
jgi:hypothetical protein